MTAGVSKSSLIPATPSIEMGIVLPRAFHAGAGQSHPRWGARKRESGHVVLV
jgi:hypothetical protein